MEVLHPPFVHFVIALPLVSLFSQLTYLATKDKTYSKATTRILAFSLLVSFFALFTGIIDAQKIINSSYILEKGLKEIEEHKEFGFVVVGMLFVTTLLKWIACRTNKFDLEKYSVVFIVATILLSLYQGREGGIIVYKYSGGIKDDIVKQRIMDKFDPIEDKECIEKIKRIKSVKKSFQED
ncbi:DUF2231 domain-containing protein [Nitrosophilus alvini]|uniref:DUF2231 domain-containing protein n=1 Tax=Nitrosophilus alvini TaxID=2714855 RepID=UPI00190B5AC8|nr:DUF2231 domain-containing protein [Nitrosophilus alvini]